MSARTNSNLMSLSSVINHLMYIKPNSNNLDASDFIRYLIFIVSFTWDIKTSTLIMNIKTKWRTK